VSNGERWRELASDYETARQRPDSLDRILEWPLQQEVVGDPRGLRILDLGCGSGAKAVHWAHLGAAEVTGVDISGQFVPDQPGNVRLISGDLSDPDTIDEVRGRVYNRPAVHRRLSDRRDSGGMSPSPDGAVRGTGRWSTSALLAPAPRIRSSRTQVVSSQKLG
jgi:SAM-dependent methyltransferase